MCNIIDIRKKEISQGILSFPEKLMEIFRDMLKDEENLDILEYHAKELFQAVWNNFLLEKETSLLVWYEVFNNAKAFNTLLMLLSKSKWCICIVEMNYASIKLNEEKLLNIVSKEELIEIKRKHKTNKYRLKYKSNLYSDLVKINNTVKKTGLIREGFKYCSRNEFYYDTDTLYVYSEYIAKQLKKGLSASTKDVTYQEIIDILLNYYTSKERKYSLNTNISDSRGRSIYQCQTKVFNPISSKEARALLKLPVSYSILTEEDLNHIYCFISELLEIKETTINNLIERGMEAYETRKNYKLKTMIEENDYDNLYKLIWLERIYNGLDNYFSDGIAWDIPIEIDMTASVIGMIGVIYNINSYMELCNITGNKEEIKDAWRIDGLERNLVKKSITPISYGSSKHPTELWLSHNFSFTQEDVNKVNDEIKNGRFKPVMEFRDFIIENVNPKYKQDVKIWNDKFFIECNKFKWEQQTRKSFYIYNTSQEGVRKVAVNVRLTPDLKQFKRFFVTCLIHNCDSQLANNTAKFAKDNDIWILTNHDSFLLAPQDVTSIRKEYINNIKELYYNRKEIRNNYFKSIGITKEMNDYDDYEFKEEEFKEICLR